MRVIACFMVVFLHSAAPLLYQYNDLILSYWFISNIYDSTVRVCVPLFFMVSGFLLLQKDEPLTAYFSKRFSKLFIPIVFWSIFFVFWSGIVEKGRSPFLGEFYSIVFKPSYYHLWFLYALVGLYLIVPILRVITSAASDTLLMYYCAVWFLAVSLIPLAEKVSGLESQIDLNSISGYIGYFVLGLILGKKEISSRVHVVSAIVYIFAVVIAILGTYVLTLQNDGIFLGDFYSYLAPNTIIASCACFIVIKYSAINSKTLQRPSIQRIIKAMSSCSFGIYLVHVIFIYLLENGTLGVKLSGSSGNPLWYIPITSILVFILSFLLVFIIKKTPILRLVAP